MINQKLTSSSYFTLPSLSSKPLLELTGRNLMP